MLIAITILSSTQLSFAYQIVVPKTVEQGDPLHVFVTGKDSSKIVAVQFGKEKVWPFTLEGKPHAIFGIGLNAKPGNRTIYFTDITSSSTIAKTIQIVQRKKPNVSFAIPEKLGGNTKQGEKTVLNAITNENEILLHLMSTKKRLWKNRFSYPLQSVTITDTYGYSRQTGGTVIAHKGTDFKAKVGTPVYAMNDGAVRLTRKFIAYGNTIVIDHGEGVFTIYMHLSDISVKEGDKVKEGDVIGHSGETGYANGPHLHISVKVSGESIDPMLFMKYVGTR